MAAERGSLAARFGSAFAWNYVSRIAEFGLRFLFVSLVARGLGAAGFGVYGFANSIVTAATLLSALGYQEALNTFIPRLGDDRAALRTLLRRLLARRLALTLAAALAVLALVPLLRQMRGGIAAAVPASLLAFAALNLFNLLSYFLIGRLDLRPVAAARVLVQLANLAGAWLLLARGGGPATIFFLTASTATAASLWLVAHLRPFLRGPGAPIDLRRIDRFSATLGLTNAVNYLLGQQSDIFLLGLLLADSSEVGRYTLAGTLTLVISTGLLIGFEGVTQTALAERAEAGAAALAPVWEVLMKVTAALTVPFLGLVMLLATPLLALYGTSYLPAAGLLQLALFFALIGRFFGGGTNTATLYALGHERFPLAVRVISGLVNLALNIPLILWFGAAGAILATGLSGLLTVIPETVLTLRLTGARYPVRFMAKVLAASAASWAVAFALRGPGLGHLLGAGGAALLALAGALIVLKPLGPAERALVGRASPRLAAMLARFE